MHRHLIFHPVLLVAVVTAGERCSFDGGSRAPRLPLLEVQENNQDGSQ